MAEVRVESSTLLLAVFPQFFPSHWLLDAPDLVFTDFPSRIRLGYVVRGHEEYSYVTRHDVEQAGISLDELNTIAIQNLSALPVPGLTVGKTPGGSEAFLGDVSDNFRAVRILLPHVHEALLEELGHEYLVAIPCRDWFSAWSKCQAADWQQRNIKQALQDFLSDDYNLTPDILLRTKDGFSMFLSQQIEE
jgi:hypothetical protein